MNTTLVSLLRTSALALTLLASLVTPAGARSVAAARAPAASSTVAACSWDRPGIDPFMGDVAAAVDRYQDIAADVRERLKARMVRRDYDDVVSIRRDSITGRARARYGSAIRDMHFGNATLCRSVSRAAWSPQMQERGLVYCEGGQCILVPTVCRNVSRIARAEVAPERAEGDEPEAVIPPVAALDVLPAPFPVDLSPPLLALDAGPAADAPPGGRFFGGGPGAAGGGGGTFAGGSGGGSGGGPGRTTIAATSGNDGGFAPGSSPPASSPVSPVPEPETWATMVAGIAALAARRRRRT